MNYWVKKMNKKEINHENYRKYISDIEERSRFRKRAGIKLKSKLNSIVFLMPVTEYGYNFGQFRIASHMVTLGVEYSDLHFFPLYLNNGKYEFDEEKLMDIIHAVRPRYIGVIAYLGWEYQLKPIIELAKCESDATILMGGPLVTSHLEFSVRNMGADVVFLGHGEFLVEEYLFSSEEQKTSFPKLDIKGVFYAETELYKIIPYQNRNLDALYWDMHLLSRLCSITPVINLFSSDVCFGNCIFCYRSKCLRNSFVSRKKLISSLELICCSEELKEKKIKYLRFLDDDFFAADDRDLELLIEIYETIKERYQLYELQFSLRSIRKFDLNEFSTIIDKIGLKRITIGVDGYNDTDLKFLRKGYNFKEVLDDIKIISQKTNCMLYAILTTPDTTIKSLNESFINMLKLVMLDHVYIGPTINPVISLHSNNKKLYPSFMGDNFCYLNITDINIGFNEIKTPENFIMQADILPKNRVVRDFIESVGLISKMESAYIVPLLLLYYKKLSEEYNWAVDAAKNGFQKKTQLMEDEENIRGSLKELKERSAECTNMQSKIECINNTNFLKRRLVDICEKREIMENSKTAFKQIEFIESSIRHYIKFYDEFFNANEAQQMDMKLCKSINRMLPLPIKIFDLLLEDESNKLRKEYSHILNQESFLSEGEIDIFRRFLDESILL